MPSERRQLTTVLLKFYSNPVARVSFELFLTVGAVLFFGLFAIRPTLVTMSNLVRELEQKRELDSQLSQKIAALSSAQTQFAQIESSLPVIDEAIPDTPLFVKTIKIIERIASNRELVVTGLVSPEVPDEVDDPLNSYALERVSIPLSISVQGDYPTIRTFIEDLRQSRRTIVVESVTFSVAEDEGDRAIAAEITLTIPYYQAGNPMSEFDSGEGTSRVGLPPEGTGAGI